MCNRKRIIGLFLIFMAVILLCLIGDGLIGKKTYEDEGEKKEVKTYTLELKGDIKTGYEWECHIADENIAKLKSKEYEEESKENDLELGKGTFIFEFEGLQKGETEVELRYVCSWEAKTEPVRTIKYHLYVDEDKNVTKIQQE